LNKRLFILNGLFILGVAINHAAGWGYVAMTCWAHRYLPFGVPGTSQVGSLTYYVIVVIRQLTAISVAGFLFTAGCFLVYAAKGTQNQVSWKFIRSRILSLAIPYLIWSIIIFIQMFITDGVHLTPLGYLRSFLSTGADGPYYFVPLLCYLYLLSPFLIKFAKQHPIWLLVVAGIIQVGSESIRYLVVTIGSTPVIDFLMKLTPDWSVPRWILFFCIGMVVGYRLDEFRIWLSKAQRWLVWVVAVAALVAIVEPELVFRLTEFKWEWRSVPFPISHQIYSILAIFLLMTWEVEKTRLFKPLYYLAGRSFGVYLLHHKVMEVIGRLTYHLIPGFLAFQIPLVLLFFIGGLGIPLAFIKLVQKSPARRFQHYVFG
jgi:fucose 4-O-acetylase-like acetyltransferase